MLAQPCLVLKMGGGGLWQQLAGSRLERTIRLAAEVKQRVRVQVLALVTEPMGILRTCFTKRGHAAQRTPPLLDDIWEPTSLAYRVLCYYFTLLQRLLQSLAACLASSWI